MASAHAHHILRTSKYPTLSAMAESWLGDWTMAELTDEEAIELAALCEEKRQNGDERDYSVIVKETMEEQSK